MREPSASLLMLWVIKMVILMELCEAIDEKQVALTLFSLSCSNWLLAVEKPTLCATQFCIIIQQRACLHRFVAVTSSKCRSLVLTDIAVS